MKSAWQLFGAMVVVVIAGGALADDYVVMKNGDRFSGELKKIWDDEVFIDPEYGETYAIKMKYVAHIHTDAEFDVEFVRGRRTDNVRGTLGLDEEGNAAVLVDDGRFTYPMDKIDNMLEIEKFFDWEFRSDISANITSGNTETNNGRIYIMGTIKLANHHHKLELTRDGAKAEGEVTKDQSDVYYEDMWSFRDDWFVRGSINWTRDPIRDLQSRSQYYIGPGYQFWNDSKRTLNLSIGPTLLVEDIGEEQEQSASIQTVFRYEQEILEDFVVFQQTDYQTVVTGRENRILNTSTGFRWELPRDVYVNIQLDYDYESNPAEGRQNEDLTYLVGVGIKLD